jgi:hypothetical protein
MKTDRPDARESAIQAYRAWLDEYSWDHFCTLKLTSGPPSKRRAEELFQKWIKAVEKAEGGADFRWFRVMECGSFRSNPHFHVLVGGLRNRMQQFEQMWAELGGNAMLMNFDPTKDGILYILKGTNNRGDLDFDCKLPSEQTQKSRSKIKRSATTSPQNRKQEQRGNSRARTQKKKFPRLRYWR